MIDRGVGPENSSVLPPSRSPMIFLSACLVLLLVPTAIVAQDGAGGHDRPPPRAVETPPARAHHQLTRHAGEELVYLIGGSTPGDEDHRFFDDVWTWNGERWRPAGRLPFPRSSHRVVYDPGRRSLLLFGGTDGDSVRASGALWELRRGSWSRRTRSDRAGADEPGACYDRRRERLILYGGARADRSYGASTWEWDGRRLRRRATEGPGPRLGHVLAWDPVLRRCLLFGGRDVGGTVHGDTWSWDGSAWRRIEVEGPPARWIHAAATDEARDRVVIFGGQDPGGDLLGDTWTWNGTRWSRIATPGPAPRMMGRMAPDGVGVLMFGGRGGDADGYRDLGDTWRLEDGEWKRLGGPPDSR